MNEEPTKELPNRSSFEERVFARFDSIDARLDAVDARLDAVDARLNTVDARLEKLESRALDTKPIWERALAAIMELALEMGEVKSKVGAIESRVGVIEEKVAVIETDVAALKNGYSGIRNELVEMKRDLKHQVNKRLDLILEFLLEGRDDLRAAEERIRQLETKLA